MHETKKLSLSSELSVKRCEFESTEFMTSKIEHLKWIWNDSIHEMGSSVQLTTGNVRQDDMMWSDVDWF